MKTTYRISMKKEGQKWRENLVEISSASHLTNYISKMEEYGWKVVGIEVAKESEQVTKIKGIRESN